MRKTIKSPSILSIDTSCDETSAAITQGLTVLSNVVWSQSKIHAKFGGVVPSVARRQHERKISWVVERAVNTAKIQYKNLDAVSVTVGPGLAIALGVGINFAKNLAIRYQIPIIAVNHLDAHLMGVFAQANKNNNQSGLTSNNAANLLMPDNRLKHPAFGIVVSGGNTLLVQIEAIGKYEVVAQTIDDALGESLDKSARLLGFGYPGGAVLEKFAKKGNPNKYHLPLPLLGREDEGIYSYSGIKTAFNRLVTSLTERKILTRQQINDLASTYQKVAFDHFFRISKKTIIKNLSNETSYLLAGGGVAANVDFRKRVRTMCKKLKVVPVFSYNKKLYGDNAAMVGISAYFKFLKKEFSNPENIDRLPNLKIDQAM